MDADDSPAPKGSLRKFLEHLSGAGKAIGVLTSGGDAQELNGAGTTRVSTWKRMDWTLPHPTRKAQNGSSVRSRL
ncbi:ATP-dependent 6-phosphofructokinase, platelet type-like isoform X2 [Macaca fascicularis]|uniref:ATP-dependent 6-phosphofructokinase, platelet type-like isoform X2 n=1 Tax=Macaca fascicularis TaxID=9541 RepID=UPI003D154140